MRVIQIEPSFFGKPWIQPRASAKSRSTQMYGQCVTSSPSSSALTTRKNSRYCERDGSTSSPPPSEDDCQSAKIAAQRPASGCGSRPAGAPRAPRPARPSTRARGSRRRSATAGTARATERPSGERGDDVALRQALGGSGLPEQSRGSRAPTRRRSGRSGSTSAAAAAPTCWTRSGRRASRAERGRAELLHVAVELDEARLLDDPDVARDVAADAVPGRAPAEPAAVAREPVEQVAHLTDVDDVEGEVVEVRDALVDQRHHVMVRVDAEPHALGAQPVADAHPEHLACRSATRSSRSRGEEVDVAELARRARPDGRRAARVRHPAAPARGTASSSTPPVGVGEVERAVDLDPVEPAASRRRRGLLEGAVARRARTPCGGARPRPRRARASRARPRRRAARDAVAAAVEQARTPATSAARASSRSATPQADVVDPAEADHARRAAIRSASSSGTASATWIVFGGHVELVAGPGEVDVPLDHGVREPPEPVDLHLDDVARLHRPRVRGRARSAARRPARA